MLKDNVFTLGSNGGHSIEMVLKPYVRVRHQEDKSGLVIPNLSYRGRPAVTVEPCIVKDQNHFHCVTAASVTGSRRIHLVKQQEGETSTLLLVCSIARSVCSSEGVEHPHFRTTHMWPGADGALLLCMKGRWGDPEKTQFFSLKPNEHILFIDSHLEVTCIRAHACGSVPTISRASNQLVADYVLAEAQRRGEKNVSAREWGAHALAELGCQWHIDELQKTFSRFRIAR